MPPLLRYSPYGYVNHKLVSPGGDLGGIIAPILGASRLIAEYMPEDLDPGGWPDISEVYDLGPVGTPVVLGGGPNGQDYIHQTSNTNTFSGGFPTPANPQIPARPNIIIVTRGVTSSLFTYVRGLTPYTNDWLRLNYSASSGYRVGVRDTAETFSGYSGSPLSTADWSVVIAHHTAAGFVYPSEHQGVTHNFGTATVTPRSPRYSGGMNFLPSWSSTCDISYVGLVDGEITGADLIALSPEFVSKFGIALV